MMTDYSMMYQKNRFSQTQVHRQLGQATVELVLLVMVSVILVLTLAFQIYQPFSTWLDNYMGSYLECLIDIGELPTVSGSARGDQVCGSRFEPFTMTRGRPPIIGSGSDSSGASNSGSGGSGSNSASSSSDGPNRSNSNTAGGADDSGSSGTDGSSSNGSRRGSGSNVIRSGTAGASDLATDEEARRRRIGGSQRPSQGSGDDRNFIVGAGSDGSMSEDERSRRLRAIGVAGMLEDEQARSERLQPRVVRSEAEGDALSSSKKIKVKSPDRKVAMEEDQQDGWNLGRLFRIAIIVLIIIGLVLFIGGQAVSISKGMEK